MALRIDVERVVANKSPKWYKRIPKCVFRWLARTIHQDEMNEFLKYHSEEPPLEFANNVFEMLGAKIEVKNEENMPKSGRYIVVSNHPLGGLDGLTYICLLSKYRSDIKFPVNDLLMNVKPMQGVFIPINKHGGLSRDAINDLNATFASDDVILYFPAGLCSRKFKDGIRDLDWKSTIIHKAQQYQRDIIPAYFDGENSKFFYRLANIRKKLHIKFNIEMLYLPDEMFKQKGKKFTITFGKPIPYQTFTNEKTKLQWTEWLREQTYSLRDNQN